MWTQQPVQRVDPLCLPVGLRIGPWRVVGFGGRGAYGTLYCVEREGHEADGPGALKLATYPEDERFQREAWLLSHVHSPYVPALYAQGVWEHDSGRYPYLVMELRRSDGRAVLTDFGAGHYRSAGTLTSKLLPPGTPGYRSPEAWAFLNAFLRHPTVHYPASTCDDLFALGVMAYRLVTDVYPPSTQPGEAGAEVWSECGGGPRRPSELNGGASRRSGAGAGIC